MYGEDSSGRRVSLLNDSSSTTIKSTTFSPPKLPYHSRISSSSVSSSTSRDGYNSSPATSRTGSPRQTRSPPTPQLVRHNSQSSPSQSTPSPMTPNNGFDMMDSQHSKNKNYNDLLNGNGNSLPYYSNPTFGRSNGNSYPTLHEVSQQPYYNLDSQHPLPSLNGFPDDLFHHRGTLQPLQTQLQHPYNTNTSPIVPTPSSAASTNTPTHTLPPISAKIKSDPNTPITTSLSASTTATANGPNTSASKTPPMKKKYPCPHAVRHNCTDTFTTSGHAARHGKKHTGEKNILCPTCKKAFTRKDNMKQHERTHKNPTSSGSKSGSVAGSPVISSNAKGSRRASASAGIEAMDLDSDGASGMDPPSSRTAAAAAAVGRTTRPKMQRSELSEIMEGLDRENGNFKDEDADADGEGESPGLDALATAASEMA